MTYVSSRVHLERAANQLEPAGGPYYRHTPTSRERAAGWYVVLEDGPTFLGANAFEAYSTLRDLAARATA